MSCSPSLGTQHKPFIPLEYLEVQPNQADTLESASNMGPSYRSTTLINALIIACVLTQAYHISELTSQLNGVMAPPTVYKSHRTPIYIHSTACNITTGIKRPDDSMSKNVPPKLKNDTTTGNGGSAKCQLVRSLTKRNEKASYMSTRVLLICVTVFELAVVYLCLFGIFVQNSTLVVPYGAKIITEASTYWICVWICFYTDGYYCPLDSKILIAVDDDLIFSSSAKITVIVMLLVTFFFYKTALCFLLVESIDTIDRLSSSSIISNQTTYSQPGESQAISSTGDGLNMSIMRGNTLAIIDDSPPKYAELFA